MDNEGHFYQVGQDWGSCGEAFGLGQSAPCPSEGKG